MRDPGQGGRHRQTWRWSTPARIVGCGDASSRSVATAGDLVPSSAMAMLQLDVRGLVVSASSDAAMLERGEKKTASGCPRRQVCMRFREEETALLQS
ncbi:hypothetical protein [Salmonella enterica]|uniref:hypothetical protein n=1 Tax=Salmonella enterica TaxID=28901 RepID=UPI001FD0E6B6|nr:hypothetical protein [Salmonella enterica]